MKILILRGIPGSGKSTLAKAVQTYSASKHNVFVFSADHFFLDDRGHYKFDINRIGLAHADCFRRYCKAVTQLHRVNPLLVVDNTSIRAWEIAPYVLNADTFAPGSKVLIYTLHIDPQLAASRQIHGVPSSQVWRMFLDCNNEQLPAHWNKLVGEGDMLLDSQHWHTKLKEWLST